MKAGSSSQRSIRVFRGKKIAMPVRDCVHAPVCFAVLRGSTSQCGTFGDGVTGLCVQNAPMLSLLRTKAPGDAAATTHHFFGWLWRQLEFCVLISRVYVDVIFLFIKNKK